MNLGCLEINVSGTKSKIESLMGKKSMVAIFGRLNSLEKEKLIGKYYGDSSLYLKVKSCCSSSYGLEANGYGEFYSDKKTDNNRHSWMVYKGSFSKGNFESQYNSHLQLDLLYIDKRLRYQGNLKRGIIYILMLTPSASSVLDAFGVNNIFFFE